MKFYVTTPIYYVNDFPHIGHSYTTIAADVLARWNRLKGSEVFFLTGTDEHGAKIAEAAAHAEQTPKAFSDTISEGFKSAWKKLDISNDHFLRTTDPEHEKAVQFFLEKLFSSGNIYKSKYEGLYCVQCEKYLTAADLDEKGCCPDHKLKPIVHSEENYFFKLSAYREKLLEIISDQNNPRHLAIYPIERKNEIIGKLKTGLEDISISRAKLEWGIPLPFDPKQTVYVWVDALLNYITGLGYRENSETFRKFWPADVQLMAKDILWFHSVIWPAMLLAAKLPTPKKIFAHGFFTINGQKMSKTLGNVIRPDSLIERFGVDASRYLALSLFPFGSDGDISWNALTEKYNSDLANNLGNLVSRTLTMIEKFSAGRIPSTGTGFSEISDNIFNELTGAEKYIENLEFSLFINSVQSAIDKTNRYIEITAPWKMAKENNANLAQVLFNIATNLKIITIFVLPFMPRTCGKIWELLGETKPIEQTALKYFADKSANKNILCATNGAETKKGEILFLRLK